MAPTIDVILLTHATIAHLGAYSYLCKTAPEFNDIPVYATLPVINLGRMVTIEAYRSVGLLGPFQDVKLTMSDIEASFDKIEPLKYSQPLQLTGKLKSVTLTAYKAGHTLGGTIWRLQYEQESVLYAVDWNHTRDSHLDGALLEPNGQVIDVLVKPSFMVCGSKMSQSVGLKKRNELLLSTIDNVLARGGTVLLPTSAARVLELVYLLDSHWHTNRKNFPLLYASYTGKRTLQYASSMLEWMSQNIMKDWEVKNESPFDTRHLQVVSDIATFDRTYKGPKVILADDASMDIGFAKALFAKFGQIPTTTIILTEVTGPGTVANELWKLIKSERLIVDAMDSGVPVPVSTKLSTVLYEETSLKGRELAVYNESVREQQRQGELQNAIDMRNRNILEQEESDSSEDEDDEMILSGQMDLGILIYGTNIHDFDVRTLKGKNRTFPLAGKRVRVDDYGEAVRHDDFLKINSRREDEVDTTATKPDSGGAPVEPKLGEKRTFAGDASQQKRQGADDLIGSLPAFTTPHKLTKTSDELSVNCSATFIDFEGLTDERSLKMILASIQPKKLALLPEGDDVDQLADSLLATGIESVVEATPNVPVVAAVANYAFDVKVTPEMESLLKWQKVIGEFSVAHVVGKLELPQRGRIAKNSGQEFDSVPVANSQGEKPNEAVDLVPEVAEGVTIDDGGDAAQENEILLCPLNTAEELAAAPRSNPLLVGDVRLAELKRKLISLGHRAEFRAEGLLVCDDKVAVRKIAEGRIVIEGSVDSEFYETKDVVRSLLAVV
jgi:cleavage and polyadenylation specificity factor subunit 2